MRYVEAGQAGAGLAEEFLPVDQHADTGAFGRGLFCNVAENHRLAAASGEHEQHRAVALLVRLADLLDGSVLVGAEVSHQCCSPCSNLALRAFRQALSIFSFSKLKS